MNVPFVRKGENMKAYILSTVMGTVQIGDVVYQPATNARFKAGKIKKGEYIKVIEVTEKSMEAAREALQKAIK